MAYIVLVAIIIILIGIIYKIRESSYSKSYHHKLSKDHSDISTEFITRIANQYNTYEDFLINKDFDDYFLWWNSNPKELEKLKNMINDKKEKNNLFSYKKVNF